MQSKPRSAPARTIRADSDSAPPPLALRQFALVGADLCFAFSQPQHEGRGAHHPHIGVRSCGRTCGRKPTDLSNRPIAVATNSSDRRGDRMSVVLLLHKTRFAGICVSARVHGRVCQRASVQLRAQPRVHGRCIGPKGSRSGTTDQE